MRPLRYDAGLPGLPEDPAVVDVVVMPGPFVPPLQHGDIVRIEEADYLYGAGPLVLLVHELGPPQARPDGWWLTVRGVQLGLNGSKLVQRRPLVRLSALVAVRPPGRRCP